MTTSIHIENLSTGYKTKRGPITISGGLTASLGTGEMTCLLGPNGAGKSTLLRTLCAVQPALAGQIEVMGGSLQDYSQQELSRLISVVLTDNRSIRGMTAYDVVGIGRSPYTGFWGRLKKRDEKMIDKCFQWVGIEPLKKRKMETLSDGECQKVMIAKAIAQETPIIFLDEPTAYLDYPSKIQMMMLLHRLAKTLKKTIFLSTHDLEHALQIADQVWLLDQEHGLTTGTPEDLSIEGHIERYFNRDGILFDKALNTFDIRHETARLLKVTGQADSLAYKLCCKALLRNGIQPVTETTDCPISVNIPDDGTYRLLENGKEHYKAVRIEHLLRAIVPAIVQNQIAAIRQAADMDPYE